MQYFYDVLCRIQPIQSIHPIVFVKVGDRDGSKLITKKSPIVASHQSEVFELT
jgi:hypothetical protein